MAECFGGAHDCMLYSPDCIFIQARSGVVKRISAKLRCVTMAVSVPGTWRHSLNCDGSTARIAHPFAGALTSRGFPRNKEPAMSKRTHAQKTSRTIPSAHQVDSRKFRHRALGLRPPRRSSAIEFGNLPPIVGSSRRAGISSNLPRRNRGARPSTFTIAWTSPAVACWKKTWR